MGTVGYSLPVEELYDRVIASIVEGLFDPVDVMFEVQPAMEEGSDLETIFAEYCIVPQNAEMNETTFAVTKNEVWGYGFDLEQTASPAIPMRWSCRS